MFRNKVIRHMWQVANVLDNADVNQAYDLNYYHFWRFLKENINK